MDLIPIQPLTSTAASGAAISSQEQFAEGRIFAAQVLQLLDGGSVILGIGRERIAATSQAALQVGQRLLLKARGTGAARIFELVIQDAFVADSEAAADMPETEHPFRLLAQGQGLGELLSDLAQALSARGKNTPAAAQSLARELQQFAWTPGESGPELARQLSNSGLTHEARKLAQAIERLPNSALASAAEELVALAFAELEGASEIEPARRALGLQLKDMLGDAQEIARLQGAVLEGVEHGGIVAKALAEWIGPALERSLDPSVDAAVRARIGESFALARLSPRLARAVLETLLGEHAGLSRLLEERAAVATRFEMPDFKQWLSAALDRLEPGPEREALRVAHEALEAEQFVALARASHGDGSSWVLALRDGSGFADARLVHQRSGERESEAGHGRGRRIERAVLGLEFSRTGPVRAELALDDNTLNVRLGVSRVEVAARLQASLDDLSARLAASGRSVQLSVAVRAAEDLRVPGAESDDHLSEGRLAIDRFG